MGGSIRSRRYHGLPHEPRYPVSSSLTLEARRSYLSPAEEVVVRASDETTVHSRLLFYGTIGKRVGSLVVHVLNHDLPPDLEVFELAFLGLCDEDILIHSFVLLFLVVFLYWRHLVDVVAVPQLLCCLSGSFREVTLPK